ncbi:MAG: acetylornithine deacetylase [Planctomycetaceae bacterium]|nr:acetylornithine deacetylase [Planctomycetaceae bacterium]
MPEIPIPNSCEDLLTQMVSFDTVNHRGDVSGSDGTEAALLAYLEHVANQWGLATQRLPIDDYDSNLLVSSTWVPGAPTILFDSHMDTVSVDGMTIEPFAGRIHQERIFGRGACDTKGSGAAMLWALKRFCQQSEPTGPPANIAILFNVDEEISMKGVVAFVRQQMAKLDWQPNAVIVGEPTEMQMVTATGGIARWSIHTHGVAVHSSQPAKGRSAISAMMRVIEAVENDYIPSLDTEHPLVGKAQCSINLISGGTQINVIPDTCEIRIDRRLVPGEDPLQVLPAVETHLDRLRAGPEHLEIEQDTPFLDTPLEPSLSQQFSNQVGELLQQNDLSPQAIGVSYGTNASKYPEAGIPAIVLGPGSIEQAHTVDEWITLEQLELGQKIYFDLMSKAGEFF